MKQKMILLTLILLSSFPTGQSLAWEIDLSRRQAEIKKIKNSDQLPVRQIASEQLGLVEKILEKTEPTLEIVIVHTDQGFVPEKLPLREGQSYKIHVVNLHSEKKNLSFVMDAFSEYHNIFYGQMKTFTIHPKTSGVFTYQCPETAMVGQAIVAESKRKPASQE